MTHTVTLDSETTNLDPSVGHWWELAFIVEDHPLGVQYDGEWDLIRPHVPLAGADPMALRIGRFYERCTPLRLLPNSSFGDLHVQVPETVLAHWREIDGPRVTAVDPWYTSSSMAYTVAVMLAGAVVVGNRPEFDLPFISKWLAEHGHHLAADYHTIDVAQVSLGRVDPSVLARRKYRSDDLAALLDVPPPSPEERHTALGDARWARRWLSVLEGTS